MVELKVLKTKPELEKEEMIALLDKTKKAVKAGEVSSLTVVVGCSDGSTYNEHTTCDYAPMVGATMMAATALARKALDEGEE